LDFLRANAVDKLVDAYAVHVYPWSGNPGNPLAGYLLNCGNFLEISMACSRGALARRKQDARLKDLYVSRDLRVTHVDIATASGR
jgi:hypothetical protein